MKDRVEQQARRIQSDGLLKCCRDTVRKVVPEAKVAIYTFKNNERPSP